MTPAFPLQWPAGWPRTKHRYSAKYKVSAEQARKELLAELRLLGASGVVISSNVPLRQDGYPHAGASERRYDDPGVAVYFTRHVALPSRSQQVIACDKWARPDQNLRAVGLAVAGLRAISRSGASELLDRAFTGFKALPPAPTATDFMSWWSELGLPTTATLDEIDGAYKMLAMKHHPDRGGNAETMARINRARDQARRERGMT